MEDSTNSSEELKKVQSYNDRIRALADISDALDISYAGVSGIYNVCYRHMQTGKSFTGLDVVRDFIRDLLRSKREVKDQLESMNIKTAEDIGRVIFAICEKGIMRKEETDTMEIYQNVFTSENINAYIKKEKIRFNRFRQIGNIFYIIGLALIILKLSKVLPAVFLYTGGVLCTVGWLMTNYGEKLNKRYMRWKQGV